MADIPSPFVEKRRTIVEGIFSKFETKANWFSYTKVEMEGRGEGVGQIQRDIRQVIKIRRYGVPALVVYLAAFLYALFAEWMWLIPLMWLLAIFIVFMGSKENRIMCQVTTNPQAIRWLCIKYAMTWIEALLLAVSMTALVLDHAIGLLIGLLFAVMRFTDSYRDRFIIKKLNEVEPDMPTYEQAIERMS